MDKDSYCTLQDAVKSGLVKDVKKLLRQGVDVNARPGPCSSYCGLDHCHRCDTALMAAVRREDIAMVRLLMAHGADPSVEIFESKEDDAASRLPTSERPMC